MGWPLCFSGCSTLTDPLRIVPMRAVAVIPARMGSKRFPGKVLTSVRGEPLVVHVWRRLLTVGVLDAVYVATGDDRVAEVVSAAGGEVLLTKGIHRCGTDRVAEAIEPVAADIVVNVQADCAQLDPVVVDQVVSAIRVHDHAVVTPVTPLTDSTMAASPDCVKAVVDETGRGIYFSRSPVPHSGPWLRHVGIYGFRRQTLETFAALGPSRLELAEDLEQLRLIDNGIPIQTILTDTAGISVDSPSDLRRLHSQHPSQIRGTHA